MKIESKLKSIRIEWAIAVRAVAAGLILHWQ